MRPLIRLLALAGSAWVALAALALIATPAFAAAPETPEVTVKPSFASIAVLGGVLSPKGKVRPTGLKGECAGEYETTPESASGGAPKVLPPERVRS
jgi:hypothetical protein